MTDAEALDADGACAKAHAVATAGAKKPGTKRESCTVEVSANGFGTRVLSASQPGGARLRSARAGKARQRTTGLFAGRSRASACGEDGTDRRRRVSLWPDRRAGTPFGRRPLGTTMRESAELQPRISNKSHTRCICQPRAVGAMLAQSPLNREPHEHRENPAETRHCASSDRRRLRRGLAALRFRDGRL